MRVVWSCSIVEALKGMTVQVQTLRCSAVRSRYGCPASCQGILVPSALDRLLPLPPWLPHSWQLWQQCEDRQGSGRQNSGCQRIRGASPAHSALLHMTWLPATPHLMTRPPRAVPACPGGPLGPALPPQIPASLAPSTIQLRSPQGEECVRLRPAARCCCQSNQPGDKTLLLNINYC